jgi:ribosomal RNA-processing protein 8
MDSQLHGSRFRWLNESLYTTTGREALDMFRRDPGAFDVYHDGFRRQVEGWPENPVDRMITLVRAMPADAVIADLGCGEARLAASVPQKVHSFDLVAVNDRVTYVDGAECFLLGERVAVHDLLRFMICFYFFWSERGSLPPA